MQVNSVSPGIYRLHFGARTSIVTSVSLRYIATVVIKLYLLLVINTSRCRNPDKYNSLWTIKILCTSKYLHSLIGRSVWKVLRASEPWRHYFRYTGQASPDGIARIARIASDLFISG
jgi:hypothetical protein